MLSINYPEPSFRVKRENNRQMLFDPLRKRWLLLTPEEWVRQNFIQYLIQVKEYPSSYISQEKAIMLGELKKRFDILVYDREHKPWMIVECKAMSVELNEETLQQALRYNLSVPVPYIVITNGNRCMAWRRGEGFQELKEIPVWNEVF